jgi:hypothetical protein
MFSCCRIKMPIGDGVKQRKEISQIVTVLRVWEKGIQEVIPSIDGSRID